VGWDAKADEAPNVAIGRENLIAALGQMGDPDVQAEAHRRFEIWLKDPNALSAGVRKAMLNVVARNADAATWEQLHARAKATQNAVEKLELYQLLGSASDPALAKRALDLAVTDEPGPTNGPAVIRNVADQHPALAFDFVLANEAAVYARIETSSRTRYVPGLVTSSTDTALADRMMAYAAKTFPAQELGAAKSSAAAVAFRARIKRERLPEIVRWTAAHGG
jgi:aminopeptidase N